MSLPLATRILLRGRLCDLELAAGPFYEPARPRPVVSLDECVARTARLEALLARLLRTLRRLLGLSLGVGAGVGLALVVFLAVSTRGRALGAGSALLLVYAGMCIGLGIFSAFVRMWRWPRPAEWCK